MFPHLAAVYSMKPSQIRRKESVSLVPAQHCLLHPQADFTQIENVEIVKVGSRRSSPEYY